MARGKDKYPYRKGDVVRVKEGEKYAGVLFYVVGKALYNQPGLSLLPICPEQIKDVKLGPDGTCRLDAPCMDRVEKVGRRKL